MFNVETATAAEKRQFRIDIGADPQNMPDGTAGAPGWAFATEPASGVFRPVAGAVAIAVGGVEKGRFTSTGLNAVDIGVTTAGSGRFTTVTSLGEISGGNVKAGNSAQLGFSDTYLYRDAQYILALRGGLNAQQFRVYNTTDGTNNERIDLGFVSNVAMLQVNRAGTGNFRNFELYTGGTLSMRITSNGDTSLTATTASTNHLNGALTVAGGMGLNGALNLSGSITMASAGFLEWGSNARLYGSGTGVTVRNVANNANLALTAGAGNFSGVVNITDTTASTSNSTGALTVTGGVGIQGQLVVSAGNHILSPSGIYAGSATVMGFNNRGGHRASADGVFSLRNNANTADGSLSLGKLIASDHVEVTTVGRGFVVKSPDGNRWLITVNNGGAVTATNTIP